MTAATPSPTVANGSVATQRPSPASGNAGEGRGPERWTGGGLIGTFGDNSPCDAPGGGGAYMMPDGSVGCRCIVCGRCGHHTGNSNQGHYWRFCKVTNRLETFHMCCPDGCELAVARTEVTDD